MRQKLKNDNLLNFHKWKKLSSYNKIKVRSYYQKFIKNYLSLNKKFKFNNEFSKNYVLSQINELDNKKKSLKYLPIGVKDNINTKYLSTNYGLKSKKNFKVGNNANVVDKILENGGIIFSKTTCAEFAVHYINSKLNINPHDKRHIAGTSSSGSAIAVSCGALPIALGTQTAGSIIRPASFCGVYGFKPTFGSIDRTGILKNNDLFDTVGLLSSEIEFINQSFITVLNYSQDYPWTKKYFLKRKKLSDKKIRIGLINNTMQIYNSRTEKVHKFYNLSSEIIRNKFNTFFINGEKFNNFHSLHDIIYSKSLSYYIKNYSKKKINISKNLSEIIRKGEKINRKKYNEAIKKIENIKKNIFSEIDKFDYIIIPSTFSQAPKKNIKELDDTCLIWTTLGLPCINIPFFF